MSTFLRRKGGVETAPSAPAHRWRSIAWLESLGLLPEFADRLELKLRTTHGTKPPEMPIAEWAAVRETLATFWRPPPPEEDGTGRPHVFVGPPGSGKTTAVQVVDGAVLRGEHRARVWRLDGEIANTSEFLSLHCEMVGVPVERFWERMGGGFAVCRFAGGGRPQRGGMKALRERCRRYRRRTSTWCSMPPMKRCCCLSNSTGLRNLCRKI